MKLSPNTNAHALKRWQRVLIVRISLSLLPLAACEVGHENALESWILSINPLEQVRRSFR